jgi:DNA-binding NtrC family response regulator
MTEPIRVLVVDDDPELRDFLREHLEEHGCAISTAPDGQAGWQILRSQGFDVALVDLVMPRLDGLDLLRRLKEEEEGGPEVIILTGHAELDTAVEALKLGACDYLRKPCHPPELAVVIRKAWERRRLSQENRALKRMVAQRLEGPVLIAESPAMRGIMRDVKKVAATDSPVLIQGESGTGKELIARAIVQQSARAGRVFLTVNCGAFQDELLESELFGHERGAFTGAVAQKPGLFEVAHGGTLFLDEVGEMSPAMQAKLLRVLEEGEIRRVGGTRVLRVDVRVLAATNRDLERETIAGRFRKDLFYRLHVLSLALPPLRERREDIPILIAHFMERLARRRPPKQVSGEALGLLVDHAWPGNVRELENLMERLVVFSEGEVIEVADLPVAIRAPGAARAAGEAESPSPRDEAEALSLKEVERRHIAAVLARSRGNRAKAARLLGIDVKTLYNKLRTYARAGDGLEGSP